MNVDMDIYLCIWSDTHVCTYIWECIIDFPGGSDGEESACNVGEPGSIPVWGRSPGEGNGNPLQYSYLGNPTDREA